MRIIILGAAGFIGTNLTLELAKNPDYEITVVDEKEEYFNDCINQKNVKKVKFAFSSDSSFDDLLNGQDYVYHLISTNNPTLSNNNIGSEIADNISISINILEACVKNNVKKIIFISSGGTVYGKVAKFPIKEEETTNPITTYGIQKLTIEKLLYLYNYVHKLDYSIIRLANPYGPYQRPNGKLGVITTFVFKALKGEKLVVYGDGSVVRDYIYISDAINGIMRIAESTISNTVFNLGSGVGTSIKDIVSTVEKVIKHPVKVEYIAKRDVDVPVNYLDITKYEQIFGKQKLKSLEEGIRLTLDFLEKNEISHNLI